MPRQIDEDRHKIVRDEQTRRTIEALQLTPDYRGLHMFFDGWTGLYTLYMFDQEAKEDNVLADNLTHEEVHTYTYNLLNDMERKGIQPWQR